MPAGPSDRVASPARRLRLDEASRARLWDRIVEIIERHWVTVDDGRVAPTLDPAGLRSSLDALHLEDGLEPDAVLDFVVSGLTNAQVHTDHRRYFGLYNPAPTTMGVVADTLVAAFNPQLAAWSHSPFAAEVEQYVIREMAVRFGYSADEADGVFTSGGAEANHTAVLAALTRGIPDWRERGADGIRPTMYLTAEAHDSLRKAARLCGIGSRSIRPVPTTDNLRMDIGALRTMLAADRAAGFRPFMVVATAGTTSAGIIDPIDDVANVLEAEPEPVWYHVDGAWGGAAAISRKHRHLLAGSHRADSITFDAHKWLSVPMGAGMFLTRHKTALKHTFGTDNFYMPRDASGLDVVDPYSHSIQWSRRFTGLKVFMSLAAAGWAGYADVIDRQIALGETLREKLREEGWRIVNESPLPVVCFSKDGESADDIVRRVVQSGEAWVSTARLSNGEECVRACITNFLTDEEDVVALAALSGRRSPE